MTALHLIQGGIENGDKDLVLRLARRRLDSPPWNLPKSARPGDEIVIYILRYGFFARATVRSDPAPRKGWYRRYAAPLTNISLIEPPISLGLIRARIPTLAWARYPRTVTTPSPADAARIRRLVRDRRRLGVRNLRAADLELANLQELRALALLSSRDRLSAHTARARYRIRSAAIREYVLRRAAGRCEACAARAPFLTADGAPYLEPHHITRVADGGPDHPAHVIALCPNCHRRAHHADDRRHFTQALRRKLRALESGARWTAAAGASLRRPARLRRAVRPR